MDIGTGRPRLSAVPPSRRASVLFALVLSATLTFRAGAGDGPASVTDDTVEQAIQRGVSYIKSQRNEFGHWETQANMTDRHWAGNSALATLALLYAGENPRGDEMSRTLDWLANQTLNGTYVYGVRAHALALALRAQPKPEYRARLDGDLAWLLGAVWSRDSRHPGCYDYVAPPPGQTSGRWDNSVSQYGLLGVWMAADEGFNVPEWYWLSVGGHWLGSQNSDGGWGYQEGGASSGSMTAAGLASLFVVIDRLWPDRPHDAGPYLTAAHHGLNWFAREYGPPNPGGADGWNYYYLYGVERAGHASGYKYFGEKDWFRGGAEYLLQHQGPDGAWSELGGGETALRNTSFALLFLCHGRAPLLCSKLAHGPSWSNRVRDAAGLTRFTARTLERLLNWQIVALDGPLEDLLEAPVLYLYGEEAVEFDAVQVQKLREYCQRGGLLLAVTGRDSDAFRKSIESLAERAFPELRWRPVTEQHPLVSGAVQFKLDDPPMMLELNNDVRTMMLLVRRDSAQHWNHYPSRPTGEEDYHLGCNVYLYATDKATPRSRLQTPNIPVVQREIASTLRVARIKYAGRWDVEPYGWTRLKYYLNNETATRLLVTSEVALDSEHLDEFDIAYMTGTRAFELSAAELSGLRRFLARGGTLLADAAGGHNEFLRSFEKCVRQATRSEPKVLPADSFMLTGVGIPGAVDLAGTTYRRAARAVGAGQAYPRLLAFESRRRFSVIYSPVDLSAGLLGTPIYDLRGYEPESVLRIVRNLLLYANLPAAQKADLHRGDAGGDKVTK